MSLKVAVAVIFDQKQRVLITQRPLHVEFGGYWEFPGGKIEPYETPEEALRREIKEEVNLIIQAMHFWQEVVAQKVHLYFYKITSFTGEAQCCESQLNLRWVTVQDLEQFRFPEANESVIKQLLMLGSVSFNHNLSGIISG